jgi:hypothetical protein
MQELMFSGTYADARTASSPLCCSPCAENLQDVWQHLYLYVNTSMYISETQIHPALPTGISRDSNIILFLLMRALL